MPQTAHMGDNKGRKVLRIISLVLVLFMLAIPLGGWWAAQSALPVLDGVIPVHHLSQSVVVKFDNRATPSIEATNQNDAYFVQGYVTAAQRLFQMDVLRRSAKGELSEIFGSSSLAQDRLMRTVGINRLSIQTEKKLSKEVKQSLTAYSRGVNTYIELNAGRFSLPFALLGYRPKPWLNSDSLAILKYTQYKADETWQLDDLRQRILDKTGPRFAPQLFGSPFLPSETSFALPSNNATTIGAVDNAWNLLSNNILKTLTDNQQSYSQLIGSNAWVVKASMSESKSALMACDKHTTFNSPDFYYLCSIASPELHAAGLTIPGVPGIYLGRNDDICWSQTSFKVDGQDLVLEQFSPEAGNKYRTPAGWTAASEITEDIKVKFANTLVHKVLVTKDGPILSKSDENGVALAWASALEKFPVYESMWHINRAKSSKDLLTILTTYSGSPESFTYADKTGDTGVHVAGCVPLHVNQTANDLPAIGSAGTTAASGWTETLHWPSKLAFDQLPHSASGDSFAIADPPFALNSSSPYRYNRINSLLSGVQKKGQLVGLTDMAFLQGDQTAPLAELVKSEVQKALATSNIIDKFEITAQANLSKWDGVLKGDSIGASIYESFLQTMVRRILEPRLGLTASLEYMNKYPRWTVMAENILRTKPQSLLPTQERTYDTFIVTTFAESVKNLRINTHSDDPNKWTWQSMHRIAFKDELMDNMPIYRALFGHLFEMPSVGAGGDANTVNAVNVVAEADPWLFSSNIGPTGRVLIDMADADKFYVNVSLGQSEHLLSVYRNDQLHNWLRAEPSPIAFSTAQADKQMQHKLILADR